MDNKINGSFPNKYTDYSTEKTGDVNNLSVVENDQNQETFTAALKSKDKSQQQQEKDCAKMLSKMMESKEETLQSNGKQGLETSKKMQSTDPNLQQNLFTNQNINLQQTDTLQSNQFLSPNQAVDTHAQTTTSANLDKMVDKLVDEILVSDPTLSKTSEVRITLNSNLDKLQGVEITLRRDLEGLLAVEISTKNKRQFQDVLSIRSDLQTALDRVEGKEVRIVVSEDNDLKNDNNQNDLYTNYNNYNK